MADSPTRPYFIPEGLDFDALPAAVQVAVQEIVEPAYAELVLQAGNALERSAGASFVCLLFLELLDQFDLGRAIARQMNNESETAAPREAEIQRHLRLVAAKEKAGGFLLRVRQFRARHSGQFSGGRQPDPSSGPLQD